MTKATTVGTRVVNRTEQATTAARHAGIGKIDMTECTPEQRASIGNRVLDRIWLHLGGASGEDVVRDNDIVELLTAAGQSVDCDTFVVHHRDHGEPAQRRYTEVGQTSPKFLAVALNRRAIGRAIDEDMLNLANRRWERWTCVACDNEGWTWNAEDGDQPCTCAYAPTWAQYG